MKWRFFGGYGYTQICTHGTPKYAPRVHTEVHHVVHIYMHPGYIQMCTTWCIFICTRGTYRCVPRIPYRYVPGVHNYMYYVIYSSYWIMTISPLSINPIGHTFSAARIASRSSPQRSSFIMIILLSRDSERL